MQQSQMTVGEEYMLWNRPVKLIAKKQPYPGRKDKCGVLVEDLDGARRRHLAMASWIASSVREENDRRARRERYEAMGEQLNELAGIDAVVQVESEFEERGHHPITVRLHAAEMQQLLDILASARPAAAEDALAQLFACGR